MRRLGALVAALLPLGACSGHEPHAAQAEHPAQVEPVAGTDLHRVTLTARAMERIDLKTATVGEEQVLDTRLSAGGSGWSTHRVVPYSAILYDPQGRTWVYTSPEPGTFVRQQVDVFRIEGDRVLLRDGPAPGAEVASVGAAELYGTEFEVGH